MFRPHKFIGLVQVRVWARMRLERSARTGAAQARAGASGVGRHLPKRQAGAGTPRPPPFHPINAGRQMRAFLSRAAAALQLPGRDSEAPSVRAVQKVPKEHQRYWEAVLQGVDKPTAKRLLSFVDASWPLGLVVSPAGAAVSAADGKPGNRPPLYTFFLKTKREHPTKVLLVRVGEFYEATGMDAILMVQHAGLNPMGSGNPPRAGCPRANLRRTVADLVEGAGLSVVVCEETPEPYSYGSSRSRQKDRYVAAVVTPAAPHLLHGLVDEEGDVTLDSTPPLLGVAPRVGGYAVIEVDAELMTVTVTEGLTEDAVCARLHEGGLAPPLFVHCPPASAASDRRLTEASSEVEWERRMGSVFRSTVGGVVRYDDVDAVAGMVERVRRHLSLPVDAPFRVVTSTPRERPRPLYFSSASNLGLHKTRGVPSLMDYALPPGAPLAARRWLRRLLLLPPPPAVGLAVQASCRALAEADRAVPAFPVVSPANIALKLRTREANDTFFRELVALCQAVAMACTTPGLATLADSILVAATAEMGFGTDRVGLAAVCGEALQEMHAVIDHDTAVGTGWPPPLEGTGSEDEEGAGTQGAPQHALLRLYSINEQYRGRVRAERVVEIYGEVSAARQKVQQEALAALGRASAAEAGALQPGSATGRSTRPYLSYDVANNAVWLRLPRGSAAAQRAAALGLDHPKDRNGKVESGAYSTSALDTSLDEYRRACAAAEEAVREELRALAGRLQPRLPNLICASSFAVIAAALDCHVREAARRGWTLPHLAYGADAAAAAAREAASGCELTGALRRQRAAGGREGEGLAIEGMWPYWLDGLDPATVRNSFDMESMFLLTGPNMAGKSTLLRSTCAVSLLGACGLYVPAASASLPYLDAFMLRNFSADAPLEGRSSFAVEMLEMRYVLEDATADSLVLVDELGKGTEVRAGAALAGAMLEALEAQGCRGVFATHLHAMLDLDLRLPTTQRMMMEIDTVKRHGGASGGAAALEQRRPTWRMVPGTSMESLALNVAQECRLPEDVVARAEQLYAQTASARASAAATAAEAGEATGGSSSASRERACIEGDAASPMALGSASKQLVEVAELLQSTARLVMGEMLQANSTRVDRGARYIVAGDIDEMQAQVVPTGLSPPARLVGKSCVYVARRLDGWFYVGSTDSLQDRIAAHRRRGGSTHVADPAAEFAFVALPAGAGAGSGARVVEAAAIRALAAAGLPLLSRADARRRHSPKL